MAHVVIHHVVTYRLLRSLLNFTGDGGVDAVTVFIRLLTVATHHLLTDHFREIRGREGDFWRVIVGVNHIISRLIVLRLADIAFA
ncbi:hypothetical protein D3C80_1081400 [compost metagenome]